MTFVWPADAAAWHALQPIAGMVPLTHRSTVAERVQRGCQQNLAASAVATSTGHVLQVDIDIALQCCLDAREVALWTKRGTVERQQV